MALLTSDLVQALLGDVLVLVDPFPVALEVDLRGRVGTAHELHGFVLDNVGVLGLQQKMGQRLGRSRRERVGQDLAVLQP